jgi:long-chain acyl-CoA synthetase
MTEPRTLCDLYFAGIGHSRPDRFLEKRGGAYQPVSTEAFADRVRRCAGALKAAGVQRGDRVGIFAYNRLDWAVADYAVLLLGAADVPLYSTLPKDQVEYILKDSGAKLVFVENGEKAAKAKAAGVPLVSFESAPEAESFEEFLKKGAAMTVEELRASGSTATAEDVATLIYTSGTTGQPKGVMLTHGNLTSNVVATHEAIQTGPEDVGLSFLPLSHVFERIVDYFIFWRGGQIGYAESVDAVMKNLAEVRPTLLAAVPRFYEKVRQKVLEKVEQLPPGKKRIVLWAMKVGAAEAEYRKAGKRAPFWLRFKRWWAGVLALNKFHAIVGGRMRLFISGSAALSREVGECFFSLGFTILEGYGLTETSPVITVNSPGRIKVGTVGRLVSKVEVKIAEDGEILVRGPNVMKGYYNRPEETAKAVVDGWFHTGDIGEFDAEGYLKITDRKKDLLKTSGGKYVAPQPIENRMKLSPYVKNAVVVGDSRKFAAALVVPDLDSARRDGVEIRAAIQQLIDRINADLGSWEQVKKFVLLEHDFTIENGELTPTMKVKRKVVAEKYRAQIESMYAEAGN